jgi:hypothetical protein
VIRRSDGNAGTNGVGVFLCAKVLARCQAETIKDKKIRLYSLWSAFFCDPVGCSLA